MDKANNSAVGVDNGWVDGIFPEEIKPIYEKLLEEALKKWRNGETNYNHIELGEEDQKVLVKNGYDTFPIHFKLYDPNESVDGRVQNDEEEDSLSNMGEVTLYMVAQKRISYDEEPFEETLKIGNVDFYSNLNCFPAFGGNGSKEDRVNNECGFILRWILAWVKKSGYTDGSLADNIDRYIARYLLAMYTDFSHNPGKIVIYEMNTPQNAKLLKEKYPEYFNDILKGMTAILQKIAPEDFLLLVGNK